MPTRQRAGQAVANSVQELYLRFKEAVRRVREDIRADIKPFVVARTGKEVQRFAKKYNLPIAGEEIYVNKHLITHALRDAKNMAGIGLTDEQYVQFPKKRRKMDVYYDGQGYVYTDYKVKYFLNPNYEMKMPNGTKKKVCLITGGKVTDPTEFNNLKPSPLATGGRYFPIKEKLKNKKKR